MSWFLYLAMKAVKLLVSWEAAEAKEEIALLNNYAAMEKYYMTLIAGILQKFAVSVFDEE